MHRRIARGLGCLALLGVLVPAGAPVGAEEPRTPVDEAIERGVSWLKAQQRPDGSWEPVEHYTAGTTALCLLALLKSGVDRDDPAIEKGFDYLRSLTLTHVDIRTGQPPAQGQTAQGAPQLMMRTYDVTMTILALEALYQEQEEEGRYGRGRGGVRGPDLAWMRRLHTWLVDHRYEYDAEREEDGRGRYSRRTDKYCAWRYPGAASNCAGFWDHSNTQYALLALKACSRSGIDTPEEVWLGSLGHFLETQRPSEGQGNRVGVGGGLDTYELEEVDELRPWGYVDEVAPGQHQSFVTPRGSMTVVGIASIVLCRSELLRNQTYQRHYADQVDGAVRDGIAWLDGNWSIAENPRAQDFHLYYYLYGLERVGVLAKVENIGRHFWYDEGAAYLLDRQQADGAWFSGRALASSSVTDTCFALLFLKRGTVPVEGDSYQVGGE